MNTLTMRCKPNEYGWLNGVVAFLTLLSFGMAEAQPQRKAPQSTTGPSYFPAANQWEERLPAALGLSAEGILSAIEFAKTHEVKNPRNMEENHYRSFGKEPFGQAIGPLGERGDPTGLIIYKGYIVGKWGNPAACEITNSVTKSLLSTVVGLAVSQQLIKSIDDRVAHYVPPIELYTPQEISRPAERFGTPDLLHLFNTPHNQTITWEHLLRQTSDWEGTLWGKPDWADRPSDKPNEWLRRQRMKAGSVYEYNDVRVNVLALAATSVWRKPLPQVLKTLVMDPIGASSTWRWTGYRNAWIVLDGQPVQSVSGGGHWGGGMFINAYDMARFGLLTMHKGTWNGKRILDEDWLARSTTPTTVKPDYGFMNFFLNTDQKLYPSAPATAYAHIGNGTNVVYVDAAHELVVVARWIDNKDIDELIKRVLASLKP